MNQITKRTIQLEVVEGALFAADSTWITGWTQDVCRGGGVGEGRRGAPQAWGQHALEPSSSYQTSFSYYYYTCNTEGVVTLTDYVHHYFNRWCTPLLTHHSFEWTLRSRAFTLCGIKSIACIIDLFQDRSIFLVLLKQGLQTQNI